ncbi:MAG TPA: Rieske 2Fe-2S domain-containing protein [Nitrospiria bacterium]|jgi:nitrite reductase/ring-hydroxylating ferredoxin subunit|nr:Rieske 2Fe-2S domain-containing protein [Nitrospiria bacterium]
MHRAVARIGDIPEGSGKVVQVDQRKILVLNIDGDFHALDSFCTHRGAPLVKGEIIEGQLLCPWHGNTFDVIKGICPIAPEESVRTYPVALREGQVWVAIEDAESH